MILSSRLHPLDHHRPLKFENNELLHQKMKPSSKRKERSDEGKKEKKPEIPFHDYANVVLVEQ